MLVHRCIVQRDIQVVPNTTRQAIWRKWSDRRIIIELSNCHSCPHVIAQITLKSNECIMKLCPPLKWRVNHQPSAWPVDIYLQRKSGIWWWKGLKTLYSSGTPSQSPRGDQGSSPGAALWGNKRGGCLYSLVLGLCWIRRRRVGPSDPKPTKKKSGDEMDFTPTVPLSIRVWRKSLPLNYDHPRYYYL